MTVESVDLEIGKLAEERQQLWSNGENSSGRAVQIGRQIADLYEEKRMLIAHQRAGKSRSDIIRNARVESELERLSSR